MPTRRAALVLLALTAVAACDRAPRSLRAAADRALDAGLSLRPRPSPVDASAVDVPRPVAATDAATDGPATDAARAPLDVGPDSIDELTLDDLRLIAVAATATGPVAMVTTPSGRGVTLRRGLYVGRPERARGLADGGALTPVERWRVARITPSRLRREPDGRLVELPAEVVFTRPDPRAPATPEERSLALSPPDAGRDVGSIRLVGPAPTTDVPVVAAPVR